MVGDVPAAVDIEAGDATRRHLRLVQKHVVPGATPADRVGVRVPQQDQGVGYEASTALVRDAVLQRPGRVVGNLAEAANVHVSPRRPGPGPGWPRGMSCG